MLRNVEENYGWKVPMGMIEIAPADIEIHLHGDPCLSEPSHPVKQFGAETMIPEYAERLVEATMKSGGIAVAAPQLNIPAAMFAYRMPGDDRPRVVCNPKLSNGSRFMWAYKEGCLSLPGMFWWINRPKHVLMHYQDLQGVNQSIEASDLKGRCFQHECDHLAGRMILSRLTLSERKKAQRALRG